MGYGQWYSDGRWWWNGCRTSTWWRAALAIISCGILSLAGGATGLAISPSSSFVPQAPTGVDVTTSTDGPWTARLKGADPESITSVVYWIRDARQHWRSTQTAVTAPFEAPIDWWDGDNAGAEVVTAHVTLSSGRIVKDPGGWRWIRTAHTNPGGVATLRLNADGSAGASYQPAAHQSVISRIDFWLRDGDDHWAMAGTASSSSDGTYSTSHLLSTDRAGWNGAEAALSIHVTWPNGTQYVDPVPWVRSDHFLQATPTPAAPRSTPPPPTSAPAASDPVTAPTPPPPPAAAPAPAAPATPASCYPLTNSGRCYEPGAFCRAADRGTTGRAGDGETIVCRNNNGLRWEPA